LIKELQAIESKMGRERKIKDGPRIIDLDILTCEDIIIKQPHCVIPHPRMHEREFVLRSMMELDPDYWHPYLRRTIKELWDELHERNEL
jgi:2-amino-4-hydroxy-6-hydroxymethyldihydropteridine diphosphokinase